MEVPYHPLLLLQLLPQVVVHWYRCRRVLLEVVVVVVLLLLLRCLLQLLNSLARLLCLDHWVC